MDKELINRAWRILPAEFKRVVKAHYVGLNAAYKAYLSKDSLTNEECDRCNAMREKIVLYNMYFGHHNLTSDAEGEEMLTVEANLVKELYQRAKEVEEESKRIHSPLVASKYRGIQRAIEYLFDSKCLSDEEKSVEFLKPKANSDFTPIPEKLLASKWDKTEPKPANTHLSPETCASIDKIFEDTLNKQTE